MSPEDIFARYAVRDVTPAPESDQGEKVAQTQSQGPSRGDGVADLTADDWLQIEMAAKGCVSGRSNEWPALVAAINKIRSQPLSRPMSAAWLQGFCEAVLDSRRTPSAIDAVNDGLVRKFAIDVAEYLYDAGHRDDGPEGSSGTRLLRQAREIAQEPSYAAAVNAELLKQLEESTTDLVVTIGNIGAEMRRSTDPNAASRWEGVTEHLQKQVAANRAAIARAEAVQ